jgi:hypothetical protein
MKGRNTPHRESKVSAFSAALFVNAIPTEEA